VSQDLVATMLGYLSEAGIRTQAEAEALTVEQRDEVLHVGAWCGIEDQAWADALRALSEGET